MEELYHILRQARLQENLLDVLDYRRRLRGGLEDDRIARQQRRDEGVDEDQVWILPESSAPTLSPMVKYSMEEARTHVPSKNHKHRPQRFLAYEPLEPFLLLAGRILERFAADFQQVPPPRHCRADFFPRVRDGTAHLLREFVRELILLLREEVEGCADDFLPLFQWATFAVALESFLGGFWEESEVGVGEAVAGQEGLVCGRRYGGEHFSHCGLENRKELQEKMAK